MGERDFHPLSANFLLPQWLPSHWTNYAEGKTPRRKGRRIPPTGASRARCSSPTTRKSHCATAVATPNSPYRYYWHMLLTKMMIAKRHVIFKTHEQQDDRELTDDYLVDRLVLCGTVDQVVEQILALREMTGDFGELVYAGMDWVDPALAKRSMELMATEVMPRVNRAIGAN